MFKVMWALGEKGMDEECRVLLFVVAVKLWVLGIGAQGGWG